LTPCLQVSLAPSLHSGLMKVTMLAPDGTAKTNSISERLDR
jgi:hypothetical protein